MPEPSVSSIAIYQLRVVLCGVSPLVWRRLLVVITTSIAELHEILQSAFGWSGEHLHRFLIGENSRNEILCTPRGNPPRQQLMLLGPRSVTCGKSFLRA